MTADEYKQTLETLGLTQGEASKLLGVSLRTSASYARGERHVPAPTAKLLQLYLAQGKDAVKAAIASMPDREIARIKARLAALEQKSEQ